MLDQAMEPLRGSIKQGSCLCQRKILRRLPPRIAPQGICPTGRVVGERGVDFLSPFLSSIRGLVFTAKRGDLVETRLIRHRAGPSADEKPTGSIRSGIVPLPVQTEPDQH